MTTHFALQSQGAAIVIAFGGKWSARGGMCRCPAHTDKDPSLSVRVGHSSLLFKCFAGCDPVDIIRAIRAAHVLGQSYIHSAPRQDQTDTASEAWRQTRARDIWDQARALKGSPAERYLQERGLSGPWSDALRFLAGTPIGTPQGLRRRPAMIAAVRDERGLVGIQRTFLDTTRHTRARDLDKAKLALGTPGEGAIRLAPVTETLGIAEGTETAIAAMILHGIPVWATMGNERMSLVAIPSSVTRLIILPDMGQAGHRASARSREAYAKPGRTIETRWPTRDDWNTTLLDRLAPPQCAAT